MHSNCSVSGPPFSLQRKSGQKPFPATKNCISSQNQNRICKTKTRPTMLRIKTADDQNQRERDRERESVCCSAWGMKYDNSKFDYFNKYSSGKSNLRYNNDENSRTKCVIKCQWAVVVWMKGPDNKLANGTKSEQKKRVAPTSDEKKTVENIFHPYN